MTTYRVDKFVTPPANQGQIIEVSYGYDAEREVIVQCTRDRSDGSVAHVAYQAEHDEYEPWNREPELGLCLGECTVEEITKSLTADTLHGQLAVRDPRGGVWYPSDEAQAEIVSAENPEARAIEICEREPMRGEWHS